MKERRRRAAKRGVYILTQSNAKRSKAGKAQMGWQMSSPKSIIQHEHTPIGAHDRGFDT
jgi:hypothetical protein